MPPRTRARPASACDPRPRGAAVDRAAPVLAAMVDMDSAVRPAAGKWSPREIIGHLIDSASNNHQRFVRAQFMDDLVFEGYEQERWVSAQHYNLEPWSMLVGLWKGYNLHLLHVMRHTPERTRTMP